ADSFSLDKFSEDYKYYCTDLLDLMDEPFKDYLVTFFMDEGLPRYAGIVRAISDSLAAIQIVETFKDGMKPALYAKMIEHAAYYAPPYIPLVALIRKRRKGLLSFPVFEWKQSKTWTLFSILLKMSFPEYDRME